VAVTVNSKRICKGLLSRHDLRLWAAMLASIRQFFAQQNVLEVQTPLMRQYGASDPHIHSFYAHADHSAVQKYYLQTSPEYAMKTLLANGSGDIYQICKAFRAEEEGTLHQAEFTMLEWYRLGYDHQQLMDEMDIFLQLLLHFTPAKRIRYCALFEHYLDIDLSTASSASLKNKLQSIAVKHSEQLPKDLDYDGLLNFALSQWIEPQLQSIPALFIYDYPASQAALAKISSKDSTIAERFELYLYGIECANGFHELNDAEEQSKRFDQDRLQRQQRQLPDVLPDPQLLTALRTLPPCSGVAVGLDRLFIFYRKLASANQLAADIVQKENPQASC
jgi:elongation factor P--(R)-beta-lysine ligase